ncbi:MAG: universal stress protein [Desulfovibrionaceae bacterium]
MFTNLPAVEVRRILYATDLSESAKKALAWAIDLANTYGAQLVMLHVIDKAPEIVDGQVIGYIGAAEWEHIRNDYDEELDELLKRKNAGKEVMRRILKRCKRDITAVCPNCPQDMEDEVLVKHGEAVSAILETAKEKQCDLIVMGSHGHSSFLDALMGVTATRVIRRAEVPVLVVRLPKD